MSQKQQTAELEKVFEMIDQQWEDEITFLKEIVSHKSTLGNEAGVQHHIKSFLDGMGLNTTAFEPDPEKISHYRNFGKTKWSYDGRPVIAGEWKTDGEKIGKSLILQGHIDVVSAEPEELWDYPPYDPIEVDGKLYGRGMCDMKSGVTAMIFAVKAIKEVGLNLGADVQIHTVLEEECTGNGALALLDRGFVADGAIIPEPFGLKWMKSQVGVLWMKVKVNGSGAHVERADKAQNPINKAVRLVQALENYQAHVNAQPKHPDYADHPHPLNVNVGMIHSGDWPSNVPSECTFDVRIGFDPRREPEEVQSEVRDWLMEAAQEDSWLREVPPEISFYGFAAPGSTMAEDSELVRTLAAAHENTFGEPIEHMSMTGTTDMRAFHEFNIPATCYGPSGANMHAPNEYVELDTVRDVTKSIAAFILDWCKERK
ncbi:ArgE/DapE family deacylase [Thalassobacillus pellis]|uniref:ArgE/DapE family deacylase n=1 Tax=Thalassobacillus pellis TaxID=748008 RepID=UPI00195F6F96|nr:ArgE/DapE family deacylase [Thalassobacillus pellis]MBM7551642.1 acetylornithine deacetylase [Thalassobacillus pellis]